MAKKKLSPADKAIEEAMKAGDVMTPGGIMHESPKIDRGEFVPKVGKPESEFGAVTGHDLKPPRPFERAASERGISGSDLPKPRPLETPKPSKGVTGHDVK